MKLLNSIFLLFIIIVKSVSVECQETKVIRDFRSIIEAGSKVQFLQNFELSVEGGMKLTKNSSLLDELNFDFDLSIEPSSFLNVSGGYRLTADWNRKREPEIQHRYHGSISLSHNIKRMNLEYRFRYQNLDDELIYDEIHDDASDIVRNRILLSYNIKNRKLSPFIYGEAFGEINSDNKFFNQLRSVIGMKINLSKRNSIRAYLRWDHELNVKNPYNFYTIGIAYLYKIN